MKYKYIFLLVKLFLIKKYNYLLDNIVKINKYLLI